MLKKFPSLNSNSESRKMNKNINISIAINSKKNKLYAPVLKKCNLLKIEEINKEIKKLINKVNNNNLCIKDFKKGTFTVTNGGIYGSIFSIPVINFPQSSILGIHSIVDRIVVIKGKEKLRKVMYLAISYNHIIVNGKDAIKSLLYIKNLIEDPIKML